MIREIEDAFPLLDSLDERLVIAYRYDRPSGAATIDFDAYRDKPQGADRAFLRLRFAAVSAFRRIPGSHAELQKFDFVYSTRDTPPLVVQKVELERTGNVFRISMSFGSTFGGIAFAFESLTAAIRSACATRTYDSWEYRDFDDGTPIDFYQPFGPESAPFR